jgi:hypothetical protein
MVAGRRLETRTRSVLRPLDPVASENLRSFSRQVSATADERMSLQSAANRDAVCRSCGSGSADGHPGQLNAELPHLCVGERHVLQSESPEQRKLAHESERSESKGRLFEIERVQFRQGTQLLHATIREVVAERLQKGQVGQLRNKGKDLVGKGGPAHVQAPQADCQVWHHRHRGWLTATQRQAGDRGRREIDQKLEINDRMRVVRKQIPTSAWMRRAPLKRRNPQLDLHIIRHLH